MSLSELLSKKKTLEGKIEAEENRVRAIENRKLGELKTAYDTKQAILNVWNIDCKKYLIDKSATERFNKMMNQYVNERIRYTIERDLGHVTGGALQALEPKPFIILIKLYRLENWFNEVNSLADTAQAQPISDKEVSKAKAAYTDYQKRVTERRNKQ
jgi:nitrous oxide reductase